MQRFPQTSHSSHTPQMLRPSLSAVFNGVFFCSGTAIGPAPHTLAREKRDAEVPPRLAPARRRLRLLLAAPKQPAPRAPCFMGSLQIAGERTSLAIIARSFATGGVLLSDRAIRDDGTQHGQCPQRPPPPTTPHHGVGTPPRFGAHLYGSDQVRPG